MKRPFFVRLSTLLFSIWVAALAVAAGGIPDAADPWFLHQGVPRLTTPEWVGDEGVEAVIVLAIDDMRDPAKYEQALRPVIERLKAIDGRAGLSIMTNAVPPDDPLLGRWLAEGLSIECHTADHPCPLLKDGDLAAARSTFDRCIDALAEIPGNTPVAFRMPCCDSLNTVSPRFFAEIFSGQTDVGRFLEIDSSVFVAYTAADPELPRGLVLDTEGRERFLKYIPRGHHYAGQVHDHFVNLIHNYPYPYVINGSCWEIPCLVPSDWSAQHLHGENNQQTVDDWKAAVDLTVLKQGCVSLVFHPHGWITPEQIVELIDHAVETHGRKVRFLSFRDVAQRLRAAYTQGRPLREAPPAFLADWERARAEAASPFSARSDREQTMLEQAAETPQAFGMSPKIREDGSHNGFFIRDGHFCWSNEDTAVRPDFLERVSFDEVLARVQRRAAAEEQPLVPIGAAVVDITPDEPVRLTGYGGRDTDAEGVAAAIHARALAIGPADDLVALMISVDNCGIPQTLTERVYARLADVTPLPRERFAILATHSHSAPWLRDFAPNIFPNLPEESAERLARYEDRLEEKLVAVCRDALNAQRPGRLSLAHGEVGFAINRRTLQDGRWIGFGETADGPVDHRLPLLAARDEQGELIAVVANYACHCTTEPGSFNKISGDWAGCAADMLEAGHPGTVALMAIGCGADANPYPGGSHELSRAHGQSLAAEVNRLLDDPSAWRPLDPQVRCQLARIDLPLGHLPSREEWEAVAARGGVEGSRARFFLDRLDRGENVPTAVPNYPVQTWCFGEDLAMVFLGGEVVVDYQLRFDGMFDRDRLWVNAYANDVPCYIASARLLREGGYEVDSSMLYYRQPTRLAPEAEDLICDAVQKQLPHTFYSSTLQATFPGPKEPAAAVAAMVPRPGMKVVLAAAEPLIRDPVAFDWDEQGRLYVVEMGDYPEASDGRRGRVRRLSDVDGDGVYDEAVTFLDNLAYPTGIQCWRGGAIVAMAPDVLYAEDTDGDGQADLCEPVLSGFAEGNQQHRVNGLRLGLDGWLYLANGDSSGEVRATGFVPGGERREPSELLSLRGRDLRYDPATARIELVAGTTQFARSRDDFGSWFGNNNSNPIWHYALEDRYLRRNPHAGGISAIRQVAAVPGAAPVFPLSTTLARFNDFHMADRFTSACGTIIYRDARLGDGFASNAFISEPVHNLVSRLVMRRSDDGLGFVGERAADEADSEFLASSDNWFRPTTLRTGPDGAVWVADMYRAVIEHPEWIPAEYQRKMNLAAGSDLGRIYRVVPDDGCCEAAPEGMRAFFKQPWDAIPLAELVARLQSPNGWWRDLAERLLLHRREELLADGEQLAEIVRLVGADGGPGVQAVATLAALAGDAPLAELDAAVALAVASDDPQVRRAGVRSAEAGLARGDVAALAAVAGLVDDPDPAVRQQVLLSLGEATGDAAAAALAKALLASAASADLQAAGMTSLAPETVEAVTLVVSRAVNESQGNEATAVPLVGRLLVQAAAMGRADGLAEARAALLAAVDTKASAARLELAAAILKGGRAEDAVDAAARVVVSAAWVILRDAEAEPQRRVAAVQLLDAAGESFAGEELTDQLLAPQVGPSLQEAYLAVIASRGNAEAIGRILGRFAGLSPQVRSSFFDQLLSRPPMAAILLDRLADGSLAPLDLNASHRNRLIGYPKEAIAKRAAELLATSETGGRSDLVTQWLSKLDALAGDAAAGMAVFEKRCSACHRLQDVGRDVGPDLAALTDRSVPALVAAVLDPNRAVEAKYLSYSLLTTSGRLQAGLLAEETGGSVTLATAEGTRVAVPRAEIDSLVCSQRSLMPEGLEQDLTPQSLADVIAFVQSAGVSWKAFEGNQPEVVQAGEDGSIVLPASAAEIYGPSLVFEQEFGNLGWWASDADYARWTVDVPHGGDWIVELDFACDDSAAGDSIRFSTGTRMLTARVPGTGSWANYQTWRVGTLDIFGGRQQITVTAVQPPRSALIDLKAIRLLPPE
jgi:putative membrane-bound dehydrogenase-like protein